jgi:hypothetical protein
MVQSKDIMHELQLVIRRMRDVKSGIKIEGVQYLAYRKNMKKAIVKAHKNMKAMKNEFKVSSCTNKDNETFTMLSILKEAEAVTVN